MRPLPPPDWPPDELETTDDLVEAARQMLLASAGDRGLRRLDDPPDKGGVYIVEYADGDQRQGFWLESTKEWRFSNTKDLSLAVGWASYQ